MKPIYGVMLWLVYGVALVVLVWGARNLSPDIFDLVIVTVVVGCFLAATLIAYRTGILEGVEGLVSAKVRGDEAGREYLTSDLGIWCSCQPDKPPHYQVVKIDWHGEIIDMVCPNCKHKIKIERSFRSR